MMLVLELERSAEPGGMRVLAVASTPAYARQEPARSLPPGRVARPAAGSNECPREYRAGHRTEEQSQARSRERPAPQFFVPAPEHWKVPSCVASENAPVGQR